MKNSITYSTELMKEYKPQEIISDQAFIRAMSLKDKFVFFSIGSDSRLYIFYTSTNDSIEWKKADISIEIEKLLKVEKTKTTTFDLSVSGDTINALVALESGELLYLTADSALHITVKKVPYPATTATTDIFLSEEYIIIDTLTSGDFVDRKTIDLNGEVICFGPVEARRHSVSRKGRCTYQDMDGIYSLVQNVDKSLIYYTPTYDKYGGEIPLSKMLQTPENSTMIATLPLPANEPYTHLFAAAGKSIYFYAYNKQIETIAPVQISYSELYKGVRQMFSYYFEGKAEVWILNEKAEIVRLQCHGDDLEEPENWGEPRVIRGDIDYFYPVEDKRAGDSFYAIGNEAGKKSILHAIRSPQTSEWNCTQMALPSLKDADIYIQDVYRTKITITRQASIDEKDLIPQSICVTPMNDGFAYINGKYHYLKAREAIEYKAGPGEEITITEPVHNLKSNTFTITIPSTGQSLDINPSYDKTRKLFELDTAESLRNAKIYDQQGKSIPLTNLKQNSDYESVAKTMKKINELKLQLPENGHPLSRQQLQGTLLNGIGSEPFLLRISQDGISHYEGEALQNLLLTDKTIMTGTDITVLNVSLSDFGDIISDAINWIGKQVKTVCDILIDGLKVVFEIAGKKFEFIIDCFSKLVSSLELLFEAIGTVMKKLIDYLRFLFNANDIKYTKKVFCKLMNITLAEMRDNIKNAKGTVDEALDTLIKNIEHWGDIEHQKTFDNFKLNDFYEKIGYVNQFGTAPATFFQDIVKEQVNKLIFPDITFTPPEIEKFEKLFSKSGMDKSLQQFVFDLANNFISNGINGFLDILKKIISSIVETGLSLIKECIDVIFDLVIYIFDNILIKLFNTPIRIPVISSILEDILGITTTLTINDLMGYLIAFPFTVVYKIAFNKSPFSEQQTEAISKVENMSGFIRLIKNPAWQTLMNDRAGINENNTESQHVDLPGLCVILDMCNCLLTTPNRFAGFQLLPITLVCNLISLIPAGIWIYLEIETPTRAKLFSYQCCFMKTVKSIVPFIGFSAGLNEKKEVEKGAEAFNIFFCLIDIYYIALYLGHDNWRIIPKVLPSTEILGNTGAICDNISRCIDSVVTISEIEGPSKYITYAASTGASLASFIQESRSLSNEKLSNFVIA